MCAVAGAFKAYMINDIFASWAIKPLQQAVRVTSGLPDTLPVAPATRGLRLPHPPPSLFTLIVRAYMSAHVRGSGDGHQGL